MSLGLLSPDFSFSASQSLTAGKKLTGVWGEESQVHRVAQGSTGKLDSEVYQLPTWKRGSGKFASDKVTGTYLTPVFTFHLVNV